MTARSFAHLHCHSHFSLLDGASPIKPLVARARELGMTALAITDHGNLHGAVEFYRAARAAGVNPIVGYEAYVAPGDRRQKQADANEEASFHLTLLAADRTGFRNLVKLSSAAFLEGFYRKPRIDRELLASHHEGLICLSGCVSGELSRALLRGADPAHGMEQALDIARWFRQVFGERYFIEIQNNGIDVQRLALERSVDLAARLGIPLVATSDAHYIRQEDAVAQDVLLCINTGKFRADRNRMRMEGDQFYLRAPEEMYAAFPGLEDAVARSQEIADRVDIDLELGRRHFPSYPLPEETTSADFLRALCWQGLRERYAGQPEYLRDGQLSEAVVQRLERELACINALGFANYFLIVWDFVRFARERDIPASARGSGVGSLVAYALYLSHVCPLRYDLLFERFLDENRKEAPDIDIDFCKERRGEVIAYVKEKYGEANVAQIGTFNTLAARAAIRDVGRALNLPIPRVDQIVALVPEQLGITLERALAESPDLKRVYEQDAEAHELLDLARKIEGLARNVGTHAAAVVIADRPLVEYVPLQRITGKEELITQWAMGDVEAAGLLKMDFLGLGNLTMLAKAVSVIERTTGRKVDPYAFPLDDAATFALLCRGETKGIFQLESGGIRDLLQRMKPDHFRDIIATNALYRPGPLEGGMVDDYIQVKHGRKKAEYKHPVMKSILEETHGVMVYQEQVMLILNRLGDIELPDAYTCIKAISKKKLETIAKFRAQFVAGATAQGLSRADATELFDMVEKFAGYGFNKSHSTAYALIAYMTAYLKAHWPVEFMAALLSTDIQGRNFKRKDSLVEHLEDCRRLNIDVVPPDVNRSEAEFGVAEGRVLFGLSAIKGVGVAGAAIAAERRKNGPYRNLFEFCERLDPTQVNRAAIESLVKAGAFDALGGHRAAWMAGVERALAGAAGKQADRRSGQKGLFLDDDPDPAAEQTLPEARAWSETEQSAHEKEVLGFYLTSHPLAEHADTLRTYCTHHAAAAAALSGGAEVLVGGIISSIKFSQTRNPRAGSNATKYAMFDLEDESGILRTIIWPEEFARYGERVEPDRVVGIRGTIDKRPGSEEANLIVNELLTLDELAQQYTRGIELTLDERRHQPADVDRLYEVLRGYPGNCTVGFIVRLDDGALVRCVSDHFKVALGPEMRERVEETLGPGYFRTVAAPPTPAAGGHRNGRRFERT